MNLYVVSFAVKKGKGKIQKATVELAGVTTMPIGGSGTGMPTIATVPGSGSGFPGTGMPTGPGGSGSGMPPTGPGGSGMPPMPPTGSGSGMPPMGGGYGESLLGS